MQTNELREKYLAFFETKGCVRKPSDVLVPKWDPSVLFTPAGMNQFKDHFLGRCKLEFTRATTCQKCLRTGDIDNVGRTAYHHTFFEMLGNFSFGDYFKKEAILWAWEFLTAKKWLGIDPGKLSATVYKDDQEAAKIWLEEVGLPSNKLQYLEEDENFWPASAPSLGPDGVCGPCSEIYHETPNGTVEIWNLVFTQFNRVGNPPNNLQPLPSKNIDTGMGLERCAAVLQGVDTNYHIDILRPLVEAAGEVCKVKYVPNNENGRRLRRIADHIRACTFAVHENVYPGNKEEKYVIRRLLRRAVLDGQQMGCKQPFLFQLVDQVAQLMSPVYPELLETVERVKNVICTEEEHFIGTIETGLDRIGRVFTEMKRGNQQTVNGSDAFEMYQTYGFPPELFETLAAEHNFGFDWDGFRREMEHHGEISGSTDKNLLFRNDPLEGVKKEHHNSEFVGYDQTEYGQCKVIALLSEETLVEQMTETTQDRLIKVVLDKTPFYGEKGGQVGDAGELFGTGSLFEVVDTQMDGELVVHLGHIRRGTFSIGDQVLAKVNSNRRLGIARAHSATHLLHYVLRRHLGEHAQQQGSKVDSDLLRFDFTNHKAIPREVLEKIEEEVNILILDAAHVICQEMSIENAKKTGAMMLFGEKYPEQVRVVILGDSKELCGGTHLKNTSQIGFFKIIAEESVASGVRRITAQTGLSAVRRTLKNEQILQQTAAMLKIPVDEIPNRIEGMLEQLKKARKQIETAVKQNKISVDDLIAGAEEVNGIKVILRTIPDSNPNDLRGMIDQIRSKTQSVAVFLTTVQGDDKILLVAGLSRDLVARQLNAVHWVKYVVEKLGGNGGGGRPDMAQAGVKGTQKMDQVLQLARNWLENKLG
ncbi:MAG: alanine--tRNA ligase [Thermoguttaceae bacterium]